MPILIPFALADDEFERWKQAEQAAFSEFQTSEDRAFIAFLETEWQAFERFKGVSRDQSPKPAVPPRISNSLASTANSAPGKIAVRSSPHDIDNTFFAHDVQGLVLPEVEWPDLSSADGDVLAATWSALSSADHRPALQGLRSLANELALGDWGTLQLCRWQLRDEDSHRRSAYCWFLLNRLGYDLRIGYDGQSVFLLLPASIPVYGNNFVRLGDKPFYIIADADNDEGKSALREIRAYERSSNQSLRDFDLRLEKVMQASGSTRSFLVPAENSSDQTGMALDFDAGRSALLATHPQIDLNWYFSTPPGAPTAASLSNALQPRLSSLAEREAINHLLHFVQSSFQYQTDQEQFGEERYLLAEESLNYGINDCEDRSILLAWLLHDLLNLDVVVLDYPGHVALAVRTPLLPDDAFVVHAGKKYVVLDPTYIGADAGMVMPAVAALSPETFPAQYSRHTN
ncbi:hypothetical protein [Allohahella marinimesophila]|uniref:hypothetical protein n=1 Tax=Allohahella marinimesophila TaxID=1054972 RepID=UPI0031D5E6B1